MKHSETYDEMINGCTETVWVGNLNWEPARVLARMDPIAYEVGYNEWLDSLESMGCYCSNCDEMVPNPYGEEACNCDEEDE